MNVAVSNREVINEALQMMEDHKAEIYELNVEHAERVQQLVDSYDEEIEELTSNVSDLRGSVAELQDTIDNISNLLDISIGDLPNSWDDEDDPYRRLMRRLELVNQFIANSSSFSVVNKEIRRI